jgi:hypothetical protein
MGHFSMEKPPNPGSVLGGNQQSPITYFGHDTVDGDDDERKRSQLFETLATSPCIGVASMFVAADKMETAPMIVPNALLRTG